MENGKSRILVIGAGVNGSVCAARLHAGGVDVTVLARPQRLAVLERDGIVIENLILPALIPELVSRWLFSSKLGEFGASWHVQQAPDEMQALASDLRQMVLASSLPVPALRKVLELPY